MLFRSLLHLQRPGLVAKGFQLRVIVARFAHHSLPRARKLKPQDSMIARARNRSEQKMRRSQSQERQGVWVRAYKSLPTFAKKGSIEAVMALYHFTYKIGKTCWGGKG